MLGDAGANYYLNHRDEEAKRVIANTQATLFCIHGNHEARPESLPELYHEEAWHGGTVYVDGALPNLVFARDGEVYDLGGVSTLVVGGAYSVDKLYRIAMGWSWFADEQPSEESKARAIANMEARGWKVDVVLTHTCPHRFEPKEAFLPRGCRPDERRQDHRALAGRARAQARLQTLVLRTLAHLQAG